MRRSNSLLFWLVTVAVMTGLLAGCDGPTELDREQEIEFRSDRSTYALGDTATLTLVNAGPNPAGPAEALCSLEVEHSVEGAWNSSGPVSLVDLGGKLGPGRPLSDGLACNLGPLYTLDPGEGVDLTVPVVLESFQPGTEYRLVVEQRWFEGEDHMTTMVRSDPFTVVE